MRITLTMLLALAFMFVPYSANAQENPWHIALSSGDTLKGCKLLSFNDSLLTLWHADTTTSVPVDSVVRLFGHKKEGRFVTGGNYGMVAGLVVGAVIGAETYERPKREPKPGELFEGGIDFGFEKIGSAFAGAMIGGVAGFVIGGVIGISGSGDESYEFSKIPHRGKLMILQRIMPEKE